MKVGVSGRLGARAAGLLRVRCEGGAWEGEDAEGRPGKRFPGRQAAGVREASAELQLGDRKGGEPGV